MYTSIHITVCENAITCLMPSDARCLKKSKTMTGDVCACRTALCVATERCDRTRSICVNGLLLLYTHFCCASGADSSASLNFASCVKAARANKLTVLRNTIMNVVVKTSKLKKRQNITVFKFHHVCVCVCPRCIPAGATTTTARNRFVKTYPRR
jgi:hypothetical protein